LHKFIGHQLLNPSTSVIDKEDLPAFQAAFTHIREAVEKTFRSSDCAPSDASESSYSKTNGGNGEPEVRVRVSKRGGGGVLSLLCTMEPTSNYTERSVAMTPIHEGHAAITVICRDDSAAEAAKELVRTRYDWSYNSKLSDDKLRTILSKDFGYNKAGTQGVQLPSRPGAASTSQGLQRYLDRRAVFTTAFPDIQFIILEQNYVGGEQPRVVSSWQWTGTNNGPYTASFDGKIVDLQPSGNRVTMHGIAVDEISDGPDGLRVSDHAAYYDEASIVRQIDGNPLKTRAQEEIKVYADLSCRKGRVRLWLHPAAEDLEGQLERKETTGIFAVKEMTQHLTYKYLEQLAYAHNDAFALCDGGSPELVVSLASASLCRILQLDSASAALGVPLLKLLGKVLLRRRPMACARANAGGGSTASVAAASSCTGSHAANEAAWDDARLGWDNDGFEERFAAAVSSNTPLQELVVTQRRGSGRLGALVLTAHPLQHEGRTFWTVVLCEPSSDVPRAAVQLPLRTHAASAAEGAKVTRLFWWHSELVGADCAVDDDGGEEYVFDLLTRAVHSAEAGMALSDLQASDQPLVWISHGFERHTKYSRLEAIGRNCRFLQAESADPRSIHKLAQSIRTEVAVRVCLWNQTRTGSGFWNMVSLHPSAFKGRYSASISLRLPLPLYRRMVRLEWAIQAWNELEASPPESSTPGTPILLHVTDAAARTPPAGSPLSKPIALASVRADSGLLLSAAPDAAAKRASISAALPAAAPSVHSGTSANSTKACTLL